MTAGIEWVETDQPTTTADTEPAGFTEAEAGFRCVIETGPERARCPRRARWLVQLSCGACTSLTDVELLCSGHAGLARGGFDWVDVDGCGRSAPVRVHRCEPL